MALDSAFRNAEEEDVQILELSGRFLRQAGRARAARALQLDREARCGTVEVEADALNENAVMELTGQVGFSESL